VTGSSMNLCPGGVSQLWGQEFAPPGVGHPVRAECPSCVAKISRPRAWDTLCGQSVPAAGARIRAPGRGTPSADKVSQLWGQEFVPPGLGHPVRAECPSCGGKNSCPRAWDASCGRSVPAVGARVRAPGRGTPRAGGVSQLQGRDSRHARGTPRAPARGTESTFCSGLAQWMNTEAGSEASFHLESLCYG
jgi:hypothetical protein